MTGVQEGSRTSGDARPPGGPLETPVALLIFNRPELTTRVFQVVREARPRQLLVVADGPRLDRPGEEERCLAARAAVSQVDWDCEVLWNCADHNLSCRRRVSSGLNWVFEQVENAVVLEDDCVPHPTFFPFCQDLLVRYRDDTRVMGISGDNFLSEGAHSPYSYYFSRYTHVWGWATWRRAWKHYDVDMQLWPEIRAGDWLAAAFPGARERRFWTRILDRVWTRQVDTWDYQWSFACWQQGGLTILPRVNLVSNVGFGGDATHTLVRSPLAARPASPMTFPLCHPPFVMRNVEADAYTQLNVVGAGWRQRFRKAVRRLVWAVSGAR